MKSFALRIASTAVLFGAFSSLAAAAETKNVAKAEVATLVVHPAGEPRPALKYRLLPTFLEQVPGNAAPLYMKAFLLLADAKVSTTDWAAISKWSNLPTDKLPRSEAHKMLDRFSDILHQVELASRRTDCDWGLPLRDEPNVLGILLPDVQWARNAARLLALRTRLEIAEHRYDDAIHTLAIGYALARNVAEAPLLINGLVGISIGGLMNAQLETLLQSPGAPNLYWAIAALGDPFISFNKAIEVEASFVYLTFPDLRDVETADHTPAEWQAALDRFVAKFMPLAGEAPAQFDAHHLFAAACLVAAVPGARKALVARGRSEKEVDAMPPAKVLLLHIAETFHEFRDESFKWTYVGYPEAAAGLRAAEWRLQVNQRLQAAKKPPGASPAAVLAIPGEPSSIVGLALPALLLPAESRVCLAQAKSQRQFAALRCVEAIRIYAAAHAGKLPPSLSEIKEVPIPVNPVTGKAFPYHIEGDISVLVADAPGEARSAEKTYRIRIVP
jgi:hypothetical protein